MSESEELAFIAMGLRKASAFEVECTTHGTIRVFETEPLKEYGCPCCGTTCRTHRIRARVMTRQHLPVSERIMGRTQLNIARL